MPTLLIAGGSGLIGIHLSTFLQQCGYEVHHLSRTPNTKSPFPVHVWNPAQHQIDHRHIPRFDYIINLAGASIADQNWTPTRKKQLIDSRIQSTQTLQYYIQQHQPQVKAYLSASAIGYYGDRGDEVLSEESSAGTTGFLTECVQAWEQAIQGVAETGIRTVGIRIGLVLTPKGGVLSKMNPTARWGIGSYFGNGKQWYSWIHIQDLCQLFLYALQDENLTGFYNGVSPNAHTNKDFTKVLHAAWNRPFIPMPVPFFAARLLLGERADIVLTSARVLPKRTQETGFTFQFPDLQAALVDVLA